MKRNRNSKEHKVDNENKATILLNLFVDIEGKGSNYNVNNHLFINNVITFVECFGSIDVELEKIPLWVKYQGYNLLDIAMINNNIGYAALLRYFFTASHSEKYNSSEHFSSKAEKPSNKSSSSCSSSSSSFSSSCSSSSASCSLEGGAASLEVASKRTKKPSTNGVASISPAGLEVIPKDQRTILEPSSWDKNFV